LPSQRILPSQTPSHYPDLARSVQSNSVSDTWIALLAPDRFARRMLFRLPARRKWARAAAEICRITLVPETDQAPVRQHQRELAKELTLRDLALMQILFVVGLPWTGFAARQGPTHLVLWIAGIILLMLPLAAVVSFCSQAWPLEGGVYQWAKIGIGPFAGFLAAWNFWLWALLLGSTTGVQFAASLAYAFGPNAAWMASSRWLIALLNFGIFGLILVVNVRGLRLGKWIAHLGTTLIIGLFAVLVGLLFFRPRGGAPPQPIFSLASPSITLLSLNLFTKLAFNGLTGLEQVGVFAGEMRNPGRSIWRSAWIAAPVIAAIYILSTGSLLSYVRAADVDLTAPIQQLLSAAFGGSDSTNWVGEWSILVLLVSQTAQWLIVVAEVSRLPMVAGWDGLLPEWLTRLHPVYRTPSRSIAVVVVISVALSFLGLAGVGQGEAFLFGITAASACYGIYLVILFLTPLLSARRSTHSATPFMRGAAVSGLLMTVAAISLQIVPVIDVPRPFLFAIKVGSAALAGNLLGIWIFRRNWGSPEKI